MQSIHKLIKGFVFLVVLVCLLPSIQVEAQTTDNPFELQDRKKKETENSSKVDNTPLGDPSNPFEIRTRESSSDGGQGTLFSGNSERKIEMPRFPQNGPVPHFFLGIILFILLGLLAVLNTVFKTDLRNSFKAFTNENILKLLHREQKDVAKGPFLLLYLFYVICMGLFLFLLGNYFDVLPRGKWMMLLCIVLVGIIWVARHLLLYIIGSIFPFSKEISLYSYTISVFNHVLGVIVLPLVIFMAFSPEKMRFISIYIALVVIAVVYLYRIFRGLIIANKFLSLHKFHFFIYLCTVEIAPVVLLIKLITNWGSML